MAYNRKDYLYKKAKEEGFRSRAAYKLIELNKKYGVLRRGHKVLDLGCWPGGWVQVAQRAVGSSGVVVGIDLKETQSVSNVNNVYLITGDAREEETLIKAKELAGGKFDVVISDMSPKLTGIKEADQAATCHCVELAFWVSRQVLKEGGTLVAKAFPSGELDRSLKELKKPFQNIKRKGIKSSRTTSKEFYIIAMGYCGANPEN